MSTVQNVSRREFVKGMFSAGAFVLCGQIAPIRLWAGSLTLPPISWRARRFIPASGWAWSPTARSSSWHRVPRWAAAAARARQSFWRTNWKPIGSACASNRPLATRNMAGRIPTARTPFGTLFDVMRQAGATARTMLEQAAAQQWKVPASECKANLHTVTHQPTGRTLGYGELVAAAATLPVPAKESLKFKPRTAWRYIGKETSLIDLRDITTGKAVYGMDAHVEGMLYASIEHPPVLGGKLKSFDDKETLKVPGVKMTATIDPFKPPHVFQPLGGVAVLADNTWAAFQGRQKLKIEWDNGPNAAYNSAEYRKELEATAQKPGKLVRNVGDVDAEFAKGGKIIEAAYYTPHLAHASMEPPVAVADYRDGKVVLWTCTQNPQECQNTVAHVLGIKPEDVTCHVTLLGGGFGRKSKPDYVAEAAVLSKKAGRPVKVVWRREDDIKFDYFHSVAAMQNCPVIEF